MIWFTSDLHLDHFNAIGHSNRPYSSAQQMNEDIIKKWNKKIQPMDTVYVLGDVCWGWNSDKIKETFDRMNGIKYLIIGNHDKLGPHQKSNVWAEIVPYKRILIEDKRVILSHYPIFEWDCAWHNSIHLYGHCHGHLNLADFTKLAPHKNTYCMDVGVDTNNYEPYSWEDIKKILNIL